MSAVQVKVASVNPAIDGEGFTLKLTTVDGPEVEFRLDDMALALLTFTAGYAIKEAKARIETEKPLIFKGSAE